jgi:hypothetical protein
MSTTENPQLATVRSDSAEQGVFALLSLIRDPDGFARRLAELTGLRDEAVRRAQEVAVRESDIGRREQDAAARQAQADEALAVYRREFDDLAAKRAEVERLQADLFEARAKMEADAEAAKQAVEAEALALKTITGGLEERERLAAQVFEQGTALQHEYKDKLAQLKNIAAAG